jgi:hypothetical protein
VANLKKIARAWMDDVHELCNVSHYTASVDPVQADYNLALREFRHQRPYLRQNFSDGDYFGYQHPSDGSIVFYGLRVDPHGSEQLLFAANMEGAPRSLIPATLPIPGLTSESWEIALATPDLAATAVDQPLILHDSQGVVFKRI